jgi:hypothetical protein
MMIEVTIKNKTKVNHGKLLAIVGFECSAGRADLHHRVYCEPAGRN